MPISHTISVCYHHRRPRRQQWKHSDVYTNMDSAQQNRTDAALAKVLRAAGVPPGNIQMLEDTHATLASMRAAFKVS